MKLQNDTYLGWKIRIQYFARSLRHSFVNAQSEPASSSNEIEAGQTPPLTRKSGKCPQKKVLSNLVYGVCRRYSTERTFFLGTAILRKKFFFLVQLSE